MSTGPKPMKVWRDVDRRTFEEEIVPANEPAVLSQLLRDWPAVRAGTESPQTAAAYLGELDAGVPVDVIVGPPEIEGRFFYADDLRGFNFHRDRVPIRVALNKILSLSPETRPPAIAIQAVPVPDALPGFHAANPMPLLDSEIVPRIWLGNRVTTAAHIDANHNIAAVMGGRRRFTVFPPEQVANLYIGPLLNTPAGAPISMVDLRSPDLDRYPRFERALAAGREALLEPGDAIYIPALWWHAVESLESLNILVNYWWNAAMPAADQPYHALLHAMLLIGGLPDDQREGWRALFEHLVFDGADRAGAHLGEDLHDLMGTLTTAERDQVKTWLAKQLAP